MEYEEINIEDLPRCAEAFVQIFNSPPWNEDWTTTSALARLTEIAGTPGFVGLRVASEGQIMAFAMGYAESFDTGSDFYLKEMCVLPEFQRKGVGTALLAELKSRLVEIGARKLYLLTERGGLAARFYEDNGFHTSDRMVMMGHWLT